MNHTCGEQNCNGGTDCKMYKRRQMSVRRLLYRTGTAPMPTKHKKERVESGCKHKFKIHETYYIGGLTTVTVTQRRAICVCEKCALVRDVEIGLITP